MCECRYTHLISYTQLKEKLSKSGSMLQIIK